MDHLVNLSETLERGDLPQSELLPLICRTAVDIIPRANLISLWVFENDNTCIKSLINYDKESEAFTKDAMLCRDDYPAYFKAIVEEQLIVASNARMHSVTRDFTDSYFTPLGIYSLLDFILHKDFEPIGVICCESKGKQVEWSHEDTENIRTLATLISFCFDM